MALVASLALDVGQLIYSMVPSLLPSPDSTKISIAVGHSDTDNTLGGNAPYVALYDNDGLFIGYHKPNRKKVWQAGQTIESGNGGIDIKHTTLFKSGRSAQYVLLSNVDANAICIAQISIADLTIQTSWSGDMAKYCKMPWYASNLQIGPSRRSPKCIWLDGDNTNGFPQALSFQVDAFAESADKKAQYIEWNDTLCRSTPRFSTWQDLDWNSPIPIFKPPLKYEADSVSGGQGGDKDFGRIVDSDDCTYDKENERILRLGKKCKDKGIQASLVPNDAATKKREEKPKRPEGTKDLRRRFEGQLVVSTQHSHSATELCDSETSAGPDFVSTEEGVFCSMSQKKTFPICGHDSNVDKDEINPNKDTSVCFDLDTNALLMPESEDTEHTKRIRDELPAINYSLVRHW